MNAVLHDRDSTDDNGDDNAVSIDVKMSLLCKMLSITLLAITDML